MVGASLSVDTYLACWGNLCALIALTCVGVCVFLLEWDFDEEGGTPPVLIVYRALQTDFSSKGPRQAGRRGGDSSGTGSGICRLERG